MLTPKGGFGRQRKNVYRNWFCLVIPRCDAFSTSLTIIMRRGTTKGKGNALLFASEKTAQHPSVAEYAVRSGSVDY
jgi:hypothetical protein